MFNLDPSKLNQLADIIFCIGTLLGFVLFFVLIFNIIAIRKNLNKINKNTKKVLDDLLFFSYKTYNKNYPSQTPKIHPETKVSSK